MAIPNREAVDFADRILQQEPEFYRLTGRHTGIVGAHAELWSGFTFNLQLAATGVSSGADAVATECSPPPFQKGQTIQIKGRGSHETMHITFKTSHIDWLVVLTYDLTSGPVLPRVFLMNAPILVSLAKDFEQEFGEPVQPVRKQEGERLRIDWQTLLAASKNGRVSGCRDTWEQRGSRSHRVLAETYSWGGGGFSRMTDNHRPNSMAAVTL